MAKLNLPDRDLTLTEIDKALEEKQKTEGNRKYLGMSQIGEPCRRKLFYSFRAAESRVISAQGIKAIQDGFMQEDVMAERLRLLPFIELHTTDPDNPKRQIGFSLLLDHFRGHCDGMILGLIEAPKTWHVWEHKSVNQKKFDLLKKIIQEKGEKEALAAWDEIYFSQAIIYMHESKTERHFLTVSTPGGRDYLSVRTDYNKKDAEAIIEKARAIIFDNWVIPARLSDKREFFSCKWCDYQEICHDGRIPQVNCKTCRYMEPVKDGKFNCSKTDKIIDDDSLFWSGCNSHLFNPALISAELIEHQECSVLYKIGKTVFSNTDLSGLPDVSKPVDAIYTSKMLRDEIRFIGNVKPQEITENPEVKAMGVNKVPKAWETNKRGLKV